MIGGGPNDTTVMIVLGAFACVVASLVTEIFSLACRAPRGRWPSDWCVGDALLLGLQGCLVCGGCLLLRAVAEASW
jgi:hypothetical protein